jgi:hypothetical protein
MAGTLVADTISDGSGNTTAMTNAVKGSVRAWVNFQGGNGNTAGTINSSFNVSSITVVGTGQYTINFASAMLNANYVTVVCGRIDYGASFDNSFGALSRVQPTTTTTQVVYQSTSGSAANCREMDVLVIGN